MKYSEYVAADKQQTNFVFTSVENIHRKVDGEMSQYDTGLHSAVESMVAVALDRLPRPYGEDVIEDVMVGIECAPYQLRKHQQLSAVHGPATVNRRIGHFTRVLTGYRDGKPRNKTTRTSLAQSYTKLIPRSVARGH